MTGDPVWKGKAQLFSVIVQKVQPTVYSGDRSVISDTHPHSTGPWESMGRCWEIGSPLHGTLGTCDLTTQDLFYVNSDNIIPGVCPPLENIHVPQGFEDVSLS